MRSWRGGRVAAVAAPQSLQIGRDLLESLQRLYVGGADVDWIGFDRDYRRRRVALPTYPFRRRRHWVDAIGNPAETATIKSFSNGATRLWRSSARPIGGPVGVDLSNYPAKWACLERLTNAYSSAVLRKAGIFTRPGDRLTVQEVCNRLGAAEKYQHLLLRWLRRLAGEGQLRVDDEAFVADQPLAIPDLAARWSEAETALFDNEPLLAYIRHCGSLLHEVLAGRVSPIETLFPQGSFELAEGLYEHSSTLRYINGVAAGAVSALVAARDPD